MIVQVTMDLDIPNDTTIEDIEEWILIRLYGKDGFALNNPIIDCEIKDLLKLKKAVRYKIEDEV